MTGTIRLCRLLLTGGPPVFRPSLQQQPKSSQGLSRRWLRSSHATRLTPAPHRAQASQQTCSEAAVLPHPGTAANRISPWAALDASAAPAATQGAQQPVAVPRAPGEASAPATEHLPHSLPGGAPCRAAAAPGRRLQASFAHPSQSTENVCVFHTACGPSGDAFVCCPECVRPCIILLRMCNESAASKECINKKVVLKDICCTRRESAGLTGRRCAAACRSPSQQTPRRLTPCNLPRLS